MLFGKVMGNKGETTSGEVSVSKPVVVVKVFGEDITGVGSTRWGSADVTATVCATRNEEAGKNRGVDIWADGCSVFSDVSVFDSENAVVGDGERIGDTES